MRFRIWLFIAFVLVPIIEIVLFYYVGGRIGIGPTIVIVLITAALGSYFVAKQGQFTWNAIKVKFAQGEVPAASLVHAAMILVAGVLLLTPGFLTDIVGFGLLVPGVREAIRQWGIRRFPGGWMVSS